MTPADAAAPDRPWRRPGSARYAWQRLRGVLRCPAEAYAPTPGAVVVHDDVAATMRDGTVLRANVYLPAGDGLVNCDLRGAGRSDGVGTLLSHQEGEDVYDLVEWVAGQSWSTGAVGMIGVSYLAISQWKAAALRPPHLKAIVPWEGFTDAYRDLARPGGIREVGFVKLWSRSLRTPAPVQPSRRQVPQLVGPITTALLISLARQAVSAPFRLRFRIRLSRRLLHRRLGWSSAGYGQARGGRSGRRVSELDCFLRIALRSADFAYYLGHDGTEACRPDLRGRSRCRGALWFRTTAVADPVVPTVLTGVSIRPGTAIRVRSRFSGRIGRRAARRGGRPASWRFR